MQVVDANLVVNRPAGKTGGAVASRVAECTVGDDTGVIVLIAKNEQGALPRLNSNFTHTGGTRLPLLPPFTFCFLGTPGQFET
jgi:hypothetical protein